MFGSCKAGFSKAAVAADAGICSEIGRDVLKAGGSVVDAAIAALLSVSVVNPQSSGIGGGVIFTIYDPSTGKVETISAKETASDGSSVDMLDGDPETDTAGLLIGVPGELRGYQKAHERHGRLPWKDLFEPSIKLAHHGFPIGESLAKALIENENAILKNEALCEVFCGPNKSILRKGDIIKFPKLARTYKTISEEGAEAFYSGSLTEMVVNDIRAAGGIITREDLLDYEADLDENPLNFTMGNYTVHTPGAPFGGPVLALILRTLSDYRFSHRSVSTTENKTLTYHRMIEAFRAAECVKSNLGDPRDPIISEAVSGTVTEMTSGGLAEQIRSRINDDFTQPRCGSADEDHGTTHLSVVDEDGSAVAVTSSINNYFGSMVMSRSTGIIFNNQMKDFSKPGGLNKNNLIQPGKRPLSSMCPTIILDKHSGDVRMVVGGSGGANITTATAQVILNHLFFGYDVQRAVSEPRVQVKTSETCVDQGFDEKVILGLKQKNHVICASEKITTVQAIVRHRDKLYAKSDDRKHDTAAAGY